ncbi:MAG: hypothetical protein CMJ46_00170 [Planctomyces sp.]|nr:hypothetical protein [Planctomyces sp.]
MMDDHRKTVKHYDECSDVHELTFSCHRRIPLLTNDLWKQLLAEAITSATDLHQYRLIAFVFMPEHVDLLVYPESRDSGSIPDLLKAIKRPFSFRIKEILVQNRSTLLDKLTVQQRPGKTSFRFWLEGPGYDRNITDPATLEAAIDYIHNNPVKRNLCSRVSDWKWSSVRHFLLPDAAFDPDLPALKKLPIGWSSRR